VEVDSRVRDWETATLIVLGLGILLAGWVDRCRPFVFVGLGIFLWRSAVGDVNINYVADIVRARSREVPFPFDPGPVPL
jgi:hypothetical protein